MRIIDNPALLIPFTAITRSQVAELFLVKPHTVDRWARLGKETPGHGRVILRREANGTFLVKNVQIFYALNNIQ
jgi:hypothetical protein